MDISNDWLNDWLRGHPWLSLVISVMSFLVVAADRLWPIFREWRADRIAIFKALKAEKEDVAEVAFQITQGKWDKRLKDDKWRQELLTYLTRASAFEGSDRAKAYALDALEYIAGKFGSARAEICEHLKGIWKIFSAYDRLKIDAKFEEKRLEPLRKIIEKFCPALRAEIEGTGDKIAVSDQRKP